MAVQVNNRQIGGLIVGVFIALAIASFLGFGAYPTETARDFLLLAGGLLTSETLRLGYNTAKGKDTYLPTEENNQKRNRRGGSGK